MATMRTERMLESLPSQYSDSRVMEAIQAAYADELDHQEVLDKDLQDQLHVPTATWGLKYWEYPLGIPVNENDSLEVRRSRILSAWRSLSSQFSAKLIQNVCEAFTGGETDISMDIVKQAVTIKFIGKRGVPENLEDLKNAVEKLVHAHLGIEYTFTYLIWNELDAAALTWNALDAYSITWDEFEVWKPI